MDLCINHVFIISRSEKILKHILMFASFLM